MENQDKAGFSPESLARIIKAQFPEILSISDDSFWMTINISEDVQKASTFVKTLHEFVAEFLELHGDDQEEYQFKIQRGRELIDILHFNDPGSAHFIHIELFGESQTLRIQDVLGMSGDYTIFNSDFERIGMLSATGKPGEVAEDGTIVGDERYFDTDHVYPDFSNESIWQISPEELQPYLSEILRKVLEGIDSIAEQFELDLDDPEDMAFWAEQFEISEDDLRKAALAAGTSINDITTYLQK